MTSTPALHPHSLEFPNQEPMGEAQAGVEVVDVPCSSDYDMNEHRTYAGVDASHLAWAAPELVRLKLEEGLGVFRRALSTFNTKMRNALFMYSRVKRALKFLEMPQKVSVYVCDIPPRANARPKIEAPVTRPTFKWDVSPKDVYRWEECKARYGFDIRGTSLDWIEVQVMQARSNARRIAVREFRDREGIIIPKVKVTPKDAPADIPIRTFEPLDTHFGEIWPPVPLPTVAPASVTVTPDYASERAAARKADPDAALIGVVFIEDETTRDDFITYPTWWIMTEDYNLTDKGITYLPNPNTNTPLITNLKPP